MSNNKLIKIIQVIILVFIGLVSTELMQEVWE
jgi:hypothetical protein